MPGALGENITTSGLNLLECPRGTVLLFEGGARLQLTGLRNPCAQIEAFRPGLLREMVTRDSAGQIVRRAGVMAVVASTLTIVWNVTFNHLFERWEARQTVKGRSVRRRAVHAMGFEGGLALMLIPLMAWWFEVSLWQATWMEAGLLLFFLVYTYAFNWAFDHIFGLPASAQPASLPVA